MDSIPKRPPVLISSIDDNVAREKGRLLACQRIAHDQEKRKEMEAVFGLPYCKARYPEAYGVRKFFRSIVDTLHFKEL